MFHALDVAEYFARNAGDHASDEIGVEELALLQRQALARRVQDRAGIRSSGVGVLDAFERDEETILMRTYRSQTHPRRRAGRIAAQLRTG